MAYNLLAQHSTAQHSTAQHSTAQHSTAQHSTAQHSRAVIFCSFSAYNPMSLEHRTFLTFSAVWNKKRVKGEMRL
ncbi:hypothetical protein [Lactococcus garvieae]|uniref:Adenine methyltransferase n=1 Tax=Lactococcus garvieae TaxID=1363 RepID=A0AA46TWZ4_9LACT|nr:hypothetical protein [Lactococcus garvieae]UYT11152.1 hypothetical protein OF801_04160 [Lactococcus garvieae]